MIDKLRSAKNANFYRQKARITDNSISELFRKIRSPYPSASNNLIAERRISRAGVRWSAICFMYDRQASFFPEEPAVKERVCGFLFLIEYQDHIVIFKSRLDIPSNFVKRYLGRVEQERVDSAIAKQGAIFEKVRLRNMSVSKLAMKNKTLEADDLSNAVGPAGSARYAPLGYAVRDNTEHYSATPSTGRISQRSDRVDYEVLIDYAKQIIGQLRNNTATPAPFIRTFARSMDLAAIDSSNQPISFAVDTSTVSELYEKQKIRFIRHDGTQYTVLPTNEVNMMLAELTSILEIRGTDKIFTLHEPESDAELGTISINKSRISLRSLGFPLSIDVEIESTDYPLGTDANRMLVKRYIDSENNFIILFSNTSIAYINGTLFSDDSMVNGGEQLLRYLKPLSELNTVISEKGNFTATKTAFDDNSTFGVISNNLANDDNLLICDDLSDEWADFIGINAASSPPLLSFYHAKHDHLSLGAGPFHIAISQAIKNLKNMQLDPNRITQKMTGWSTYYVSGNGVNTRIPRVLRSNGTNIDIQFQQTRQSPDLVRRVFIVTSALSKQQVENELNLISSGGNPRPYFVQLYWLLLSFFSACTDMGANGYIICQD